MKIIIGIILLAAMVFFQSSTAMGLVLLTNYKEYAKDGDWAPAFHQAFAQSDTVLIPSGQYAVSIVRIPSGKQIQGMGSKTEIYPLSKSLFIVEGKQGEEIPVSRDIEDFSNKIELTQSIPSSTKWVMIQSQRNCMCLADCGLEWGLGQTEKNNRTCFYGELVSLTKVEGKKIYTQLQRIFPYYKSHASNETVRENFLSRPSTTIRVIEPVTGVVIKSMVILGTKMLDQPIRLKFASGCRVEDIQYRTDFIPNQLTVINLFLSMDSRVSNCHVIWSNRAIDSLLHSIPRAYVSYSRYNIFRVISSVRCGFDSCTCNFATHAFSITYGNASIPSYQCFVSNCRSENSIWAGVIAQQNAVESEFIGNTVINSAQGIASGGKRTRIIGNTVITHLPFTTNHYYAHVLRGGTSGIALFEGFAQESTIENNSIQGAYTGILIMDGYEAKNVFRSGNILIKNNRVSDCIQGFYLYKNSKNDTPDPIQVNLENNHFECTR